MWHDGSGIMWIKACVPCMESTVSVLEKENKQFRAIQYDSVIRNRYSNVFSPK